MEGVRSSLIFLGRSVMLESQYQAQLIKTLQERFPGCVVLKNDSSYMQGVPDLLVLFYDMWAMLEVKASAKAKEQPNQAYWVDQFARMSFGAFIHPQNEAEVLDAMESTFASRWSARIS